MRTGNPIIAFGDNNTEVKQILEDAKAGMMFNYDESVAELFRTKFKKNDDHKNILQYDRAVISKEFAALIKSL
jgi:hypothetical protein